MTTRKIVLWCCLFLFLATPVAAYQYWDELLQLVGVKENLADVPPPAIVAPPATEYISSWMKKHIETLQKQTLDETFAELLNGQHYFVHIPPTSNRLQDMQSLLSTRVFLKVFQQFSELPREQALEKLHQFSNRAIKEYENALGLSAVGIAAQNEDPSLSLLDVFKKVTGRFSVRGAKYMLCTTMLLTARMGEYELLLHQIDTMQSLTDTYLERLGENRDSLSRLIASLEDDCVFTVLMCALERKEGKVDVDVSPFLTPYSPQQRSDFIREDEAESGTIHPSYYTLSAESIRLYRWDAFATHYDVGIKDPNALIEQITVYSYSTPWFGGGGPASPIQSQIDKDMQVVISSLKERLAK